MFVELRKIIGEKFIMFLTDCIFTDYDQLRFCKDFFLAKGYGTKSKEVEFVKLDRIAKTIWWYELREVGRPIMRGKKEIGKKDGMKYYQYSNSQII